MSVAQFTVRKPAAVSAGVRYRVSGDKRTFRPSAVSLQRGFSLIEVSIVTAIVLLLAIVAIPAVGGYIVENKVPKVGEGLARYILQTKVNAPNGSMTPYEGIDTSNLAVSVRDSSVFTVSGTGASARVMHGLGSDGEVTVAPADSGERFTITLSKVNHAACPAIASIMQRVSETIAVGPEGQSSTIVKNASTPYSALNTESKCGEGDVNTFTFTAN